MNIEKLTVETLVKAENASDVKKSDVVVERAKPTLSGKNKGSNSNKATMSMRD